ncbi:ferritin-like domain-containing protein [Acaryochloris sp. IP29b_bin.148]|uniref:ferritin-like domain-containing protein n=1 Tax=Acaryochloris sp. IP29b_bin.148 TaxID=2969218 RepID=UPI002604A559|nr:ferritin-like domain-containing protein [Acaryochloris sp. IP29b_bin.148]
MTVQMMATTDTTNAWTKELVQSHAITAVLIEMYTLPFYLTVMTSIVLPEQEDQSTEAIFTNNVYKTILSVCIEEMLHLQLAANLCLALDIDASKIFQKPSYGQHIPYLAPYDPATMGPTIPNQTALLAGALGPFNELTLKTMLDIETPKEFDSSLDHTTPQYPYATIGQMYDALMQGILEVEKERPVFGWSTTHQQVLFTCGENYTQNALRINQTIASLGDAQQAINLICGQGEGIAQPDLPEPPYVEEQFPVEELYRFYPTVKQGSGYSDPEPDDPAALNGYSHYGRFLWIKNRIDQRNWPQTYSTSTSESLTPTQSAALHDLQAGFDTFFDTLIAMWSGGSAKTFFPEMLKLKSLPENCWKAGVIPQW